FLWSRPANTWRWALLASSGARVSLSAKSAPSFAGHQAEGIAPLGKYKKAARKGAPVAVVARAFSDAISRKGTTDSKAGNARHTPRPRRKCRRLNPVGLPAILSLVVIFIAFPSSPAITVRGAIGRHPPS